MVLCCLALFDVPQLFNHVHTHMYIQYECTCTCNCEREGGREGGSFTATQLGSCVAVKLPRQVHTKVKAKLKETNID